MSDRDGQAGLKQDQYHTVTDQHCKDRDRDIGLINGLPTHHYLTTAWCTKSAMFTNASHAQTTNPIVYFKVLGSGVHRSALARLGDTSLPAARLLTIHEAALAPSRDHDLFILRHTPLQDMRLG